jgi:hypothetical protein
MLETVRPHRIRPVAVRRDPSSALSHGQDPHLPKLPDSRTLMPASITDL